MTETNFRPIGMETLWGAHLTGSPAPAALLASIASLSLVSLLAGVALRFASPAYVNLFERLTAQLAPSLDWTATIAALVAAILALARFSGRRDVASLIVGSALGLTFAFQFVPLLGVALSFASGRHGPDWLLARSVTALALVVGIGILQADRQPAGRWRAAVASVWIAGIAAVAAGLALGAGADRVPALDPAVGPLQIWDYAPLALFAVGFVFVFPRFHRQRPTLLSFALILSTAPQLACELQVLFGGGLAGSSAFLAHSQRLLAYATLFLGLVLDYVHSQTTRIQMSQALRQAREQLDRETQKIRLVREALKEERVERDLLEHSQRMLHAAVETVRLGVTVTDLDGVIQYVNPAESEMHGYRREELLGRSARLYGYGDLNTLESEPPPTTFWDRESVNVRKDGSRFPVHLISDAVTDREGTPVGLLTICEDLSEKKASERVKENFLASVSHELRTPLTSIVAALDLLESGEHKLRPESARELSDIAYRNSHRLLRLVDDLLILQKLRAGRIDFQIEPVELRPLLESAIADIRSQAAARSVELELRDELPGALVRADRSRMLQVLANLLSNAIKYSPPDRGSRVLLSTSARAATVCISVADEGPGISEEVLGNLFEPFFRVDSPLQQEGTGLGLSIVKRLVLGMGGSVSIDSWVGRGTILQVFLPAATPDDGS